MKIVHAEFTNFRLLRNLVLDFSTDPVKNLTVIRAENESGKTTILNGLQWAFYGDSSLPGQNRQQYRLHPIDWERSEGERVPVTVEVDFEQSYVHHTRDKDIIEEKKLYRVRRSTYDYLQDDESWEPGPTHLELFELTDTGSISLDPPEARIRDELPPELREIFFTDGDRTLSFIEGNVSASTKQTRVRRAIQSLLGLELIQNSRGHVKNAAAELNKQVRGTSSQGDLDQVIDGITRHQEEATRLEEQIRDAEEQFTNFDETLARTERDLEDALRQGNREDIQRQLSQTNQQITESNKDREEAQNRHSDLFRDRALSRDLMQPALLKALAKLDVLHDQGKIPNSTIPVLEERLSSELCICGESLAGPGSDVERRRTHIQHLIEESLSADGLQKIVTDLYYGSRLLGFSAMSRDSKWTDLSAKVAERREELKQLRDKLGESQKAIEARIKELPNVNVQELRIVRNEYRERRDHFNAARSRQQADLRNINTELENLERRRAQMLRRQETGARILSNLEVAQDIETVLKNTYDRLTSEELDKVSAKMNDIFLEMIGADPQQGALIRGATITPEFEIVVYGTNERILNPDRDLNGASRRALTLSFILALTKVSEVDAPNVIDTPLGMMSGYVKQSVLNSAIRESAQLILFLTRSEIHGCEDILDATAGRVITLTNPAHYPIMLANDPQSPERTILTCHCNHRQDCQLCQRIPGIRLEATKPEN